MRGRSGLWGVLLPHTAGTGCRHPAPRPRARALTAILPLIFAPSEAASIAMSRASPATHRHRSPLFYGDQAERRRLSIAAITALVKADVLAPPPNPRCACYRRRPLRRRAVVAARYCSTTPIGRLASSPAEMGPPATTCSIWCVRANAGDVERLLFDTAK